MQNVIEDNTEHHNSVDNMRFIQRRAMSFIQDTSQTTWRPPRKNLNMHKPWYTREGRRKTRHTTAICQHPSHGRGGNENERWGNPNSNQLSRGQMFPLVRLQRSGHFHPTEPPTSWSRGISLSAVLNLTYPGNCGRSSPARTPEQ
jgi:hypothetical protein